VIALSAAKLPVAGLRRQAATGVENIYPCFTAFIAGNCRLRRRWQQHPQMLWHCLSLSAESDIPLGERTISAGNTTALQGGE